MCRARKTMSAATEAGSITPIASPGNFPHPFAQQPHADQQLTIGQHPRKLVCHGHVAGMRQRPAHESLGEGIGQDLRRLAVARWAVPCFRHRSEPLPTRPESSPSARAQSSPSVSATRSDAKAKAVFDLQRGVHAFEAVQADRVQGGLGPLLVRLQRAAQVLLDDFVDLLDRGRLDLARTPGRRGGRVRGTRAYRGPKRK